MDEESKEKIDPFNDVVLDSRFLAEPPAQYNRDKDFTSLEAWQKARDVKLFIYEEIIDQLPSEERYALNQQLRRAAISITANIAEGYGRFHYQESLQFYRIARGSLYELKDHLISCADLKYITDDTLKMGHELIEEAKVRLNGFINYIRKKLKS